MRVKTQEYDHVTVVTLQGQLDSDSAELFQDTVSSVVATAAGGLVIDLSEVGFIDSQGLERLLWLRDYCRNNQRQLRLAGLDENCAKILEITRMDKEFNHYSELSEAVKSFV